MPFSTAIDQAILDCYTGKNATFAKPTAIYIGFSSTTPTKAGGNVTEPSTGGYIRKVITAANFHAAADVGGTSTQTHNDVACTFDVASVDWLAGVNLTHLVIYDAATTGTFIGFKALTTAKPVLSGDTASVAIGDLAISLAGTF
jgi:hypothetical protein